MEKIKVSDLQVGDMVDLQGDRFADPMHSHIEYECEYAMVQDLERETPECICVYFDSNAVGFPLNHELPLYRRMIEA
jgi:hypothetical protein